MTLLRTGAVNKDIKSKRKTFPKIFLIIFSDILMFYKIFLSPQVKQCTTVTYKHDIYELSHELPNDLRLRKLGNSIE